jgi:CheY-like chemotaxis protein
LTGALVRRKLEKAMPEPYILLIEDNPDDAFLASRIIGKVLPEPIVVARDGEEATKHLLEAAEDGSYRQIRLVLLDLKLPKIHGLEVLRSIRGHGLLRDLPVVVLTSSDNDMDQQRCRELGVLDYINKPMNVERLERALFHGKEPA